MMATLGAIVLVGALFGFTIAAAKVCDPTPIKLYYIVWDNDWGQRYSEIVEAKDVASAWKRLCRKHPIDRPRCLISVEEI